ncbi:hypothetical protein Q5P01_003851 [Channa striata]|uniref:Uncharacterized protein n=1 Tax=Channa striata TaxID=64152 RepID=A0AA88T542_CHASR|nr:hypothetical protein Q5P01_003851 [Channa striata]
MVVVELVESEMPFAHYAKQRGCGPTAEGRGDRRTVIYLPDPVRMLLILLETSRTSAAVCGSLPVPSGPSSPHGLELAQLPRVIPWEKQLFLQPWEKSSYFRKARHSAELQPRNSPLFPESSSSRSPPDLLHRSSVYPPHRPAAPNRHSSSFSSSSSDDTPTWCRCSRTVQHACSRQSRGTTDPASRTQLVEQLSGDQGLRQPPAEPWCTEEDKALSRRYSFRTES